MRAFTVRNLKVFFRDKSSVFFSLLSAIIIIGLYVLFLGDVGRAAFRT
jgi:multidrug/hemolysin transport system permease protein